MASTYPEFELSQVVNLWFDRQGLTNPRANTKLTKRTFRKHLEQTGALQIDPVNVVDRAHFLTLWSRFGSFDHARVDQWIYRDRIAFEYWGHEASLLPIDHLALSRQRMKQFPPRHWKESSWWPRYKTTAASKRRVLKRLSDFGPLESADFQKQKRELENQLQGGWNTSLNKEDKRSLQLLWHSGRVAICERRKFRKVYDLAERIYPETPIASISEYHDSWLLKGLAGNGIASEAHLANYFTAPNLDAGQRAKVIARNLKQKRIVQVRVKGTTTPFFALPEHLDKIRRLDKPNGTTLICPFDSLLWQKKRTEDLLGFRYRMEIYVPEPKRQFGYYVLPILHDGRMAGRLDPKFDRENNTLTINSIFLEPNFKRSKSLEKAIRQSVASLAEFLNASKIHMPKTWKSG